MPVEYRDWIERADLRNEPNKLFIFGDNLANSGYGGQAKSMRGEPNAIGLPTKRFPGIEPQDYLTDEDLGEIELRSRNLRSQLIGFVRQGGTIVWPRAGIGTGLSKLQKKAPAIAHFYAHFLNDLEEAAKLRTHDLTTKEP
jgi:hypothetical protein